MKFNRRFTKWTNEMYYYLAWRLFKNMYGTTEWSEKEDKKITELSQIAMNKLIKDINKQDKDDISHVASVHSQFEQIHPFSDGNGRIGRLLIHTMLLSNNYAPAAIKQDNKRLYLTYLRKSQLEGRFSMWENFLCDSIMLGFDIIERK